jgi:hypothetical protein
VVYNWYKDRKVKWLLGECREKLGDKVVYDLGTTRQAI